MSGRPRQDRAMTQGLVPLGQAPGGLFIGSFADPLSHADDDVISVCKEQTNELTLGREDLSPEQESRTEKPRCTCRG